MAKVLITGMSGTGKSSALELLAERGHRTVDTDTEAWSHWVSDEDGEPDWVWREQAITELLTGHGEGDLFVAGCKSNQADFYPLFDHIVLLSAPAEVLLARIAARTTNPYGKTPEERAAILEHLAFVEPLLRESATLEINTTAPLAEVVRQLAFLT
ncbi:AAA family ATPase [Crossiella cryophila]|uniref:Dephospho-CoA kinase n=1 Tax=Crossiella cryophila TaxID=43355 RepID=A0A7W7C9H0_9PSEU|nr:AAA family ATPase [Crossiella cryophila]MBB4677024.1 dephospho-CoA kinase [Crossiella cryophila]